MSGRVSAVSIKLSKVSALALALFLSLAIIIPAIAQPVQPANTKAFPLPPNTAPPQGQPPPPGDGATPAPVPPGDVGAPPPVPTGQADPTPGHNFPVGAGRDRTIVRVYRNNGRGDRMTMTIRPDGLNADQLGRINGILGINMLSGEQTIDVTASDSQIEQINDALAPSPNTNAGMNNGRKFIDSDTPAQGYPKPGRENLYNFQGPLPTVQTFCRYLVILGVVSATVWMALAMYGMIAGHPYAGSRMIGTAAGLMLLLMGYTIWKIVQMNTFNRNSTGPTINQNRPNDAQQSDAYIQGSTVPAIPGGGGGGRSGIPVVPFGNAINPN